MIIYMYTEKCIKDQHISNFCIGSCHFYVIKGTSNSNKNIEARE